MQIARLCVGVGEDLLVIFWICSLAIQSDKAFRNIVFVFRRLDHFTLINSDLLDECT
jgi:hypothetical protein